MSGAAPLVPALRDIRTLLAGARRLDGEWGATLELCLLTLGLPWEITSIRLEKIDWSAGTVPVPARGGVERILALSDAAMKTILRVAGDAGGRGQAVTAGRAPQLQAKFFRLDRLIDKLAAADPATIHVADWNFHGIRVAAETSLRSHGAKQVEIEAALGRQVRRHGVALRGDPELACIGAERWCHILLLDE